MPIDNKTLLRVRSIVGAGGGGEGGGGADPVIDTLSVTKNGTYTAPSGVDGYSPVTVNVPEPTGTKTITANGTHDVKDYASAQVNVPDTPAVTEALTVTENGTYTPDTGVDGFDSVTVNVAGSGGAIVETGTVTLAEDSAAEFPVELETKGYALPNIVIVYKKPESSTSGANAAASLASSVRLCLSQNKYEPNNYAACHFVYYTTGYNKGTSTFYHPYVTDRPTENVYVKSTIQETINLGRSSINFYAGTTYAYICIWEGK